MSIWKSPKKTTLSLMIFATVAFNACSPANVDHPGFVQPSSDQITGKSGSDANIVEPAPNEAITFNNHIKPIFEDKCTACHGELSTWAGSVALKDAIKQTVVTDRTMPTGVSMTDLERSIVGQWVDSGALEVAPGNETSPPPAVVVPVDLEKSKLAYENNCSWCHGDRVVNMGWPSLYGMNENYFVKQMKDYRSKARLDRKLPEGGMNRYVEGWTDELILGVAKYLKTRNMCEVERALDARGGDVEAGAKIAEESCMGCHAANKSLPITGQVTRYMTKQLVQYKNGDRQHKTMQSLVEDMTSKEMLDVSAYFNSIRSCE